MHVAFDNMSPSGTCRLQEQLHIVAFKKIILNIAFKNNWSCHLRPLFVFFHMRCSNLLSHLTQPVVYGDFPSPAKSDLRIAQSINFDISELCALHCHQSPTIGMSQLFFFTPRAALTGLPYILKPSRLQRQRCGTDSKGSTRALCFSCLATHCERCNALSFSHRYAHMPSLIM